MLSSHHEYEDAGLVSLPEDVVWPFAPAHDPQAQVLVVTAELHQLAGEGLIEKTHVILGLGGN